MQYDLLIRNAQFHRHQGLATCEIAFLGGRELSLKDWQKARLTTLSQARNIEQFHRSKFPLLLWA